MSISITIIKLKSCPEKSTQIEFVPLLCVALHSHIQQQSNMSSSESSEDDIIGFKDQPHYTNIDYCAKLALNMEEVRELRQLCALIEDEEDFEMHIVVLLILLFNLSSDHIDESCMDLDNLMILQLASSSSSSSGLGSDSGLDIMMPEFVLDMQMSGG